VGWDGYLLAVFLGIGCFETAGRLLVRLAPGAVARLLPIGPMGAALVAARRTNVLAASRDTVSALLQVVPYPITWPIHSLAFRGRRDVGGITRLRIRWPLDVLESCWLAVFAASLTALAASDGVNFYIRAAAYAEIAGAVAIPCRWLINGTSLREEVRRTVRNPLVLFAVITAANFLATTAAAFTLLQLSPHTASYWDSLLAEARQLWGFSHFTAIWHARPDRPSQIVVAIAGLSNYALLVSQLYRPWQFRKTDSDRADLAVRLLLIDDCEGAKRLLGQVRAKSHQLPPEALRAEGLLAIKARDFPVALRYANIAASLHGPPVVPESSDDGLQVLGEWSEFFIRADYGAAHSATLSYLAEAGISDACLATLINALVLYPNLGENSARNGKFALWVERSMTRAARTAEAAGKNKTDFQNFSRMRTPLPVPAGITDPPFPLALSTLEGLTGQLRESAIRLLLKSRPRQLPERVVYRIVAGHTALQAADEKDFAKFRDLMRMESFGLLVEAQKWPIEKMPLWLREWVQEDIRGRLRGARIVGKKTRKALLELDRTLTPSDSSHEFRIDPDFMKEISKDKYYKDVTSLLRSVATQYPVSVGRMHLPTNASKKPVHRRNPSSRKQTKGRNSGKSN
jgi:hypothetical protein